MTVKEYIDCIARKEFEIYHLYVHDVLDKLIGRIDIKLICKGHTHYHNHVFDENKVFKSEIKKILKGGFLRFEYHIRINV